MSEFAISIEKSSSFQGRTEVWSNVYTFSTATGETFDDQLNTNWLVGIEKAVHGTSVNFLTAKSYGVGSSAALNTMRLVSDLTGTGSQTGFDIYKECAILFKFALPRSAILQHKRQGRKWLHVCKMRSAPNSAATVGTGQDPIASGDITWYTANYTTPLMGAPPGGGDFASKGDGFSLPVIHPYLEHRQFPRGRKE
jgi:hypothetical protein